MSKRIVEPFVPHTWADNDPTLSPSAEKFNDMEKGIIDAHVIPTGRASSIGSGFVTKNATVVEPGVTAEFTYTAADITANYQTFAAAFTPGVVPPSSGVWDDFGMHPGRTTTGRGGRVYIPVNGIYLIIINMIDDLSAADTNSRYVAITKNASAIAYATDRLEIAPDLGEQSAYYVGSFVAGDVVGFQFYQSSGLDKTWLGAHLMWSLLSYH